MGFTFTFIKLFFWSIYLMAPLLLMLGGLIVFLGQLVSNREKWNRFDGLYWTFITATTVGYGDMRPVAKFSKVLSIMIAMAGLILTGIIVAVALHAASFALEKHLDVETLDRIKSSVESNV